MQLGQAYHLIS